MVEKTKCPSCGKIYEIIWNDSEIEDWKDEFDYDSDQEFDDSSGNDDPVYCPFCSSHCDYAE